MRASTALYVDLFAKPAFIFLDELRHGCEPSLRPARSIRNLDTVHRNIVFVHIKNFSKNGVLLSPLPRYCLVSQHENTLIFFVFLPAHDTRSV